MTMPSMPERQSMSLPGGVITFREAGTEHEGEIPLVLLHGININSGIWMHQFAHFADQYHVVAWDAPSYGGSTPRDGDVQEYAGALCEFIDTLDFDEIYLVGHSLGGVIAGAFAGRYPNRLKALVLSCTHPGAARPAGEPLHEKYLKRIEERQSCDPVEYGRLQAAKMTTDDTPPELIEEIAAIVAENPAEYFPLNARMSQEADNRAGLAKLTVPTLIINGGHDRLGSSKGQQDLIAVMPQAQTHVFEHCGHSPYLEDPAAYNETLEAFLNKVA
ncbi:MAG: alpha/beta fold hydrolase [Rhodospirillales bacterium]